MEEFENFGDLLDRVGSKGKYQKILLYLVVTPITIVLPILYLVPIFILNVPSHWCHPPGNKNFTNAELLIWKNKNLPKEIGPDGLMRYSQCKMYDSQHNEINCPNGWDYDRSEFSQTMASEFDWVCSKAHYSTTLFTVVQIGIVIGTIVFGLMADRIGRRPVFFISLSLFLPLRLICIFIPQYYTAMVIVTFLSSLGYPLVNLIPTMILAELCDDEFRSWTFALIWFVGALGEAAVPYISYICGHWFYIALVTTLPSFLIFFSLLAIPESPRWLSVVGRTKEAAVILREVARVNGTLDKFLENEIEWILVKISKRQNEILHKNKQSFVTTLLKQTTLLKHMGLITISWVVSDLMDEVVTLNTPNMYGNMFMNFFLLAIVEATSCLIGGYVITVIGRRWTAPIFFLLCSASCFIGAGFMGGVRTKIWVVIATFTMKFAFNITHLVVYFQAIELIPTSLRSTGNSFSSTITSCFAIIAPSIVYIGTYHATFPYFLMGGLAALAMITSTFLPETMHQDLPATLEAANDFGKENSYWDWEYRVGENKSNKEDE